MGQSTIALSLFNTDGQILEVSSFCTSLDEVFLSFFFFLVCCYVQLQFRILPFSYCWWIWTMKYSLSFDIGSTVLVLMALITYWNKKKNILSGEVHYCTEDHWQRIPVYAVNNQPLLEDCYESLKIWRSLWLLNEHFELFVLVPILYKPCHETATEHLSDFIERPFSPDF